MDIYIDCPKDIDYPKSKDQFFISVLIGGGRETISFDWTIKGHRIILQRYKEERKAPSGDPNGEWNTTHISGGKFIGKEHVIWYDLDKEDWVNGRVWETIKEWPLDHKSAETLLNYVNIICNNLERLEGHKSTMQEFESELNELIKNVLK